MKEQQKSKHKYSRKDFIKTAAIAAGSIGTMGMFALPKDVFASNAEELEVKNPNNLNIKLAGYDFNKLKASGGASFSVPLISGDFTAGLVISLGN